MDDSFDWRNEQMVVYMPDGLNFLDEEWNHSWWGCQACSSSVEDKKTIGGARSLNTSLLNLLEDHQLIQKVSNSIRLK